MIQLPPLIRRFWQGAGITKKFSLFFALLILLILIMFGTSCLALLHVRQVKERLLASMDIERLVLEIDRGMEQARRLHGDFFLQAPHIGFTAAHQQYIQPSIRRAAQVIAKSDRLRELLLRSEASGVLQTPRTDLNLYLSTAKRFSETSIHAVELVTKRDAPGKGLTAQMTECINAFGVSLAGYPDLLALHLQAKGIFQEYLIHHQRPVMQSAFNVSSLLHEAIVNDQGMLLQEKQTILALLMHCRASAEEIVALDQQLRHAFNDFSLQSETANVTSRSLLEFAQDETVGNQAEIDLSYKIVFFGMSGVSLFCVAILILLARKVDHDITRNILRMKKRAQELTSGNLDARCDETGEDELGQLARTFNLMAVDIQELVSTLEDKVAQRTAQLGESEQRFRHLAANLPLIPVQGYDCDRKIIFWNRASEQLYGYAAGEVVGRKMEELIIPDDQRENFIQATEDWLDRDIPPATLETVRLHKNGSLVPVRSSQVRLISAKGELEMYAVDIDLAEIKQAQEEQVRIEELLHRAQKMEAIGLMAGGVAHDLNNILSGIVGYPDLILRQRPADSQLKALVEPIRESGKRAAAIVADLLTVARGVASVREICDLNSLIEEYLASPEGCALQARYPGIRYETHFDAGQSAISCSPVHIKKCLMNLVMNAAEAIGDRGRIMISTSDLDLNPVMAEKRGLAPGKYVALAISDSGKGIATEDLARIFEPFYTKKVMGRSGTGLGLSVVWNTVQDHRGSIAVDSNEKGSCFEMIFPAGNAAVAGNNQRRPATLTSGSGRRILVVDDEPQLRDIARQALQLSGYWVETVSSGEEAIVWLRNEAVDLVLLDMLMEPGMNGRETFEAILKIHPRQKAIIVSGFARNDEVKKAVDLGAQGFLAKPYTLQQLSEAVQSVLAGSAGM